MKASKLMLGLVCTLGLVGCNKQEVEPLPQVVVSNEFVTLSVVDAKGEVLLDNYTIATVEGDTIADIIQRVDGLEDINFELEESQYGLFLAGIEGVEQDSNEYWMVYENNIITDEGISTEDVEPNDIIEIRLESY